MKISKMFVLLTCIFLLIISISNGLMGLDKGYLSFGTDIGPEPIWIYDSSLFVKHVETADLTGDGIFDVIAGEYDNEGYDLPSKVYAINGATGETLWTYYLQSGVRSMTIGDVNNDGVKDVIAGASMGTTTPDGKVHAIDGTDGSSIWTFTPGSSGDTIGDVCIGDFNSDSYNDVAVACWDDFVYAVDGYDGSELWNKEIDSIFIHAVSTYDVNDDGIDDVSFAHEYLPGFTCYHGVLNGLNGATIWMNTVTNAARDTIMADFNNDGNIESAYGFETGNDDLLIQVYNASSGAFLWERIIGNQPDISPDVTLYAYDVDDDGDPDLVVGNEYIDYHIRVFEGETEDSIWISEELNGYARDISVGDVTGDGFLNVIAATYDRIQVLNSTNGFKTWYYSVAGTIHGAAVADCDDNGVLDVIASGGAEFTGDDPAKSVWALKTISDPPVLWEYNVEEYGSAVALGDLTNDGCDDVVGVTSNDKAWAIAGATGAFLWNWVDTDNLYSAAIGDLNGDTQNDVVVAGASSTVTALYGNNGSIMWQYYNPSNTIGRKCLKTMDVDNDGCIDVIAGCDDSTVYAIDGSNGDTLWTTSGVGSVEEVELTQMNDEGPLDVVIATAQKAVVIDGSDGDIIWEHTNGATNSKHIEAFDVNDDGVKDLAIGVPQMGATPGKIMMVDGASHSLIWTHSPIKLCSDYGLSHGDINNDSIPDVVAAGNYDDKKIHALNGLDGVEIWNYPTGGDVNVVLVADMDVDGDNEVIAGSDDQYVYILYGENGSSLWNYSTADDVIHLQTGDLTGDGAPNIAAITFGFDGVIYAFNSIVENLNSDPVASFTFEPTNPSPGQIVYFNSTSTDLDGYIVNWSWDFDDGNVGYGEQITHQYSSDGIYYVTLTVVDDLGSSDCTSSYVFVGDLNYFEMPLSTGWNLITIPVENDWMASDLANNVTGCLSVNKWDAVNQSYRGYIVGIPAFDFPIVDGCGYFVEVDQPSVLYLTGTNVTTVNIPFKIAWNIIGWYDEYNTTASSLAENITGCLSVNKWDAVNQSYRGYIVGIPAFDFTISRGMGIFLEVSEESTWQGEG